LPKICTCAARAASTTNPIAMAATMNLLRQTGVLLASKGLEL